MWIVVIEWDGKKPPMSFYNRLHKLGLYVKGEKYDENGKIGPLKRRSIEDGSVVVQEGVILCASATLAGYVASRAQDDGAEIVSIAEVDFKTYVMNQTDAKIFNRVENIYGRKGRPTGSKTDWTVTCLEEAMTYELDESHNWVECPYCSGLLTRGRIGKPDEYVFPTGDVFEGWKRHRFARGEFEVPNVPDGHGQYPPPTKPIQHDGERRVVEMMGNNPDFLEQVAKLPSITAARILDGVLVARTHIPEEKRRHKRVEAVVHLFERGVDAAKVKLIENPLSVDMLDASAVLGAEDTARLWLAINPVGNS